jgi:hypothetical protein
MTAPSEERLDGHCVTRPVNGCLNWLIQVVISWQFNYWYQRWFAIFSCVDVAENVAENVAESNLPKIG